MRRIAGAVALVIGSLVVIGFARGAVWLVFQQDWSIKYQTVGAVVAVIGVLGVGCAAIGFVWYVGTGRDLKHNREM
jgi:hypothetical protein